MTKPTTNRYRRHFFNF